MGWIWKIRLAVTLIVEVPVLLWTAYVLRLHVDAFVPLLVVSTALLYAVLLFRPTLFLVMGMWLAGTAGSSAYLLRLFPPSIALGLGTVLATAGSAIAAPALRWLPRLLLRRRV